MTIEAQAGVTSSAPGSAGIGDAAPECQMELPSRADPAGMTRRAPQSAPVIKVVALPTNASPPSQPIPP